MQIAVSNVVSAFDSVTVGTKVVHCNAFRTVLADALKVYTSFVQGKGFIPLNGALHTVSCGVARRAGIRVNEYIVREWRGEVALFAPRSFAAKAEALNVIVYTADAYRSDPQVNAEEAKRVEGADFVIVAVLASVGPKPPLSSHRFVRNLAGGNTSYSIEGGYSIEKAIAEAKAIAAYEQEWVTVAD